MVGILIGPFDGSRPAIDGVYLTGNEAVAARNIDVRSGALRALRAPRRVATVGAAPGRLVPIRDTSGERHWIRFAASDAHVVAGVTVNDAFERVYWTGTGQRPRYAPLADLLAGRADHELGITPPGTGPVVQPSGGSGPALTRAYVITWRTIYGEESAPSPPTIVTAPPNSYWHLILPTVYEGLTAPVDRLAIYRTVTGGDTVNYRFVAEVPLGTVTYGDTLPDDELVYRDALTTLDWLPPPADLRLLTRHGSGALVGAVGRTVVFSEPFVPHAWPAAYAYALPAPVVALAALGDAVIAFTAERPYLLAGSHPATMAVAPIAAAVAVPGWQAVVTTQQAIWAATPDGLIRIDQQSLENTTAAFIRPDQWELFDPATFRLTSHRGALVCRVGSTRGIMLALHGQRPFFTDLDDIGRADEQVYDPAEDRTYVRFGQDLYLLDAADIDSRRFMWQSREFILPRPVSFGVLRADIQPNPEDRSASDVDSWHKDWNRQRMQGALAPINSYPIAGNPMQLPSSIPELPPLAPIGGAPLFRLTASAEETPLPQVTVIADGRIVASTVVQDGTPVRLPAGFRARRWQVVIEGGRVHRFQAIQLAERPHELVMV